MKRVMPPLPIVLALEIVVYVVLAGPARAEFFPVFGPTDIVPPTFSIAGSVRVNSHGVAVGNLVMDNPPFQNVALRWDGSGTPAVLFDVLKQDDHVYVAAINDAGVAVGESFSFDYLTGNRGVRWEGPGTDVTELGDLGTDSDGFATSIVRAINSAGTVAGSAYRYDASHNFIDQRAVRWDASSTVAIELPSPSEFADRRHETLALDINDAGLIVGLVREFVDDLSYNVLWDPTGRVTVLDSIESGRPDGGDSNSPGTAWAINNAGTAVGWGNKYDAGGRWLGARAIRWDAGGTAATELQGLGSRADGFAYSYAVDGINDAGDIVGYATKFDERGRYLGDRAVRWDAGSVVPTELDHPGNETGGANAINAAGVAVGAMGRFSIRAAYWRRDGTFVDLNTLIDPDSGWVLTTALDISDTGWIAGLGSFDPDGPGGEDPYERLFSIHVPDAAVQSSGIPADYNNNGVVEQADLDLVLLNWGADATPPPLGWFHHLPTGQIDQDELDQVLLNWGAMAGIVGGAASVPEPASAFLFALVAGLGVCLRLRHGAAQSKDGCMPNEFRCSNAAIKRSVSGSLISNGRLTTHS